MWGIQDEFRYNKAFKYPEIVSPNDDFFSPQNFQGAFCRVYPSEAKKQSGYMIKAWKPSAKYNNSRLDFLTKLAKSRGKDYSREAIIEILNFCYEIFVNEESPFHEYVISESNQHVFGILNELLHVFDEAVVRTGLFYTMSAVLIPFVPIMMRNNIL